MNAKNLAVISEPIFKPDLVRRLLLSLFSGEWEAGDRLPEVELAQRFGVSRTPVREALQELAAIGLIELRPNCGAVARACGPREVREIYEMRAILESAATQMAYGRLDPRVIDSLTKEFKNLLAEKRRGLSWAQREWAADRQLHGLIAHECGNRRLAEEIARYGKLIQVIREVVGNHREAQVAAVEEHLAILKALRTEPSSTAADAMRVHLGSAANFAADALSPRFSNSKAN